MAERKTKFWNLRPDSLHTFVLRAWSLTGRSDPTDDIPIRTSGVFPIAWPSTAEIVAKPLYFFRCIRVTWTPLLDFSLRFSHYVLFRKDTTESDGNVNPTDAELLQSGQDIVDGNLNNWRTYPYFVKETGKFPGHTDQIKLDAGDDTDDGVVEEKEYHYWVWAVDTNGQTSYMSSMGQGYLEPDNAEFGKPNTPIWPEEDRFETEVLIRNSWWCNVKVVWECIDGAEGYWIQMKEKAGGFWSLPFWVEHDPSKATEEFPHQQSVVLNNFLCNTEYQFKIQAINVPLILYSGWSEIETYLTEEDPYPPNEIMNVSANRLCQGTLFTPKGEYINLTWDWPAGAIILQQIEYFRIYREEGTVTYAEGRVNRINLIYGVAKLAPYEETTQISGTQFIDDKVIKLDDVEPHIIASFFWNGEFGSASADDQKTAYIDINHNTEIGNLVAGAVILDDSNAYDGTHCLRTNAENKVLQFLNVDDAIGADEGYISFRFWPILIDFTATYIQILHFFFTSGFDSFWVDMRSGRLYVMHEGQNAEKELIHSRAFTAADYYKWFHIEIRWKVSTDTLQMRIDEGDWETSADPDALDSFSESPASFNIGPGTTDDHAVDCNMRLDRVAIFPSYEVPDFKQYYHYWVTAVDVDGLESLATMPGVTIDKSSDEEYHGTEGTGESYDRVSFSPPAAPELVSPLDSEAPGFNMILIIFWALYTVKMTWKEVSEATYYQVKIRMKPPGVDDWGPWMFTARIEEAYADVDENNNPFFVFPSPLQKHTKIEWAAIAGNLAGKTESDTSGEIEVLEDTEPPSKPSTPIGRCYGITDWFENDYWAVVWLRWLPNPSYQGVKSYAIFEDGDEIVTVPHIDPMAHFKMEHSFLRFGVEPVGAVSHDYTIVAIGADDVKSVESETVTINYQEWWVM